MPIDVLPGAERDIEQLEATDPDALAAVLTFLDEAEADPELEQKLTTVGDVEFQNVRVSIKRWARVQSAGNLLRVRILDTPATVYRVIYGFNWENGGSASWRLCIRITAIMTPKASFPGESSTTGTLLQTGSQPSSSGEVLYFEAKVPADKPLTGGKPLAALIRKLEARPDMAVRFEKARRTLGDILEPGSSSLRALRLAAGLSQVKLAERAGTTQSYIARIESGRLDPGTDMLERLATAIGVPAVKVFAAVRAQRERKHV